MALAEAKKLKAVVTTASPGPTSAASNASQSASVPEAQPTAALAPLKAAISRSRASTSEPKTNCCDEQTRSTAASTSSRICRYWRCKSSNGMGSNFLAGDCRLLDFAVEDWVTERAILTLSRQLSVISYQLSARPDWGVRKLKAFVDAWQCRNRRVIVEGFAPLNE